MTHSSFSRAILASTVSLGALCAAPAIAQEEDALDSNVIIVTATKRDANIQDVPFSINAQTQQDIQRAGATSLEDISRNVAGLTVQNLGPGQSQVAVRGVSAGQIVRDQPGVKEQVGIYLDESVISLSLFTPDLDLFDLNRVETLRGPQGTLFGSGSVGGTIRYITNQPNVDDFEGLAEGNVNLVDGDDLGWHAKGAVNVPLVPGKIAARVVGYYTQYGGFIDALREGGGVDEDINSGERFGGRLAVTFQPSETVTITPRVIYQEVDVDGFNRQEVFNLYANPFTDADAPGGRAPVTFDEREQFLLLDERFKDETLIADLVASVEFGGAELTSVTSYTDRSILVSRDASALSGSVSVDLGFPDAAVLLPSNLRDTTEVEQWTQEVRLSSTSDGPFQWVFGGFYSDTDRVYAQRLPTPGYDAFTDATLGAGTSAAVANGFPADSPFNSDLPYNLKQFAAFGEASIELFDRLTLTAGGRYYDYKEERTILTGGLFAAGGPLAADETKSDGFSPRFLASYEVSDDVTLNAQASKGFRLGGVNDPLNTALCNPSDFDVFGGFQSYDDETLWNYEVGVKAQTGPLRANAAVFYTDISNLQVTLDAGSCSSRISFNVPEAHTLGVEFEFGVGLQEGLDVSISGNVLEARFDSTVNDSTGAILGGIRDGNRLPSVPEFQIAVNAGYDWDIGADSTAFVSASLQHIGNRYTQPGDQAPRFQSFVSGLPFGGATGAEATSRLDLRLPSYEIVNLRAGVGLAGGLDIEAYVNNVFDENALLSFDRERGGRARLAFQTNTPRTYGLTVRKAF